MTYKPTGDKKKDTILKKVDKVIQKYLKNMQLEMQRFANEIMELKFKGIENEK